MSTQAPKDTQNTNLIHKYVGTAYDHVKHVSENLDDIILLGAAAGKYLGGHVKHPKYRLNGSPLQNGDYYLNTAENFFYFWNIALQNWVAFDPEVTEEIQEDRDAIEKMCCDIEVMCTDVGVMCTDVTDICSDILNICLDIGNSCSTIEACTAYIEEKADCARDSATSAFHSENCSLKYCQCSNTFCQLSGIYCQSAGADASLAADKANCSSACADVSSSCANLAVEKADLATTEADRARLEADRAEQYANALSSGVVSKGPWDASTGNFPPNPTDMQIVESYRIDTAGTMNVGGPAGQPPIDAVVNDMMYWSVDLQQWYLIRVDEVMTPATILERLSTVDGTGSGLDADLLDGKDSTEFLTLTDQVTNIKYDGGVL